MGLAVAFMDGLALRPGDRQARNGDSLAPQGLSSVLDLAKQTRTSWEAGQSPGSSGSDPKDEPGQSALGSTQNPWRAAQAWHQPLASHCGQVHGSAQETVFTDMAYLPEQPRK